MTALITSQQMEDTWRAVGAFSNSEIRKRQALCGKEQEELTGFVLGFASDLPTEALGLALYVHFVVVEAFRRSGYKFARITPAKIDLAWKNNSAFVNELRAAGRTRMPLSLPAGTASEPAVMQYVIDALMEESDDDPVALADDDFWHIVQVLKTVADCLHDARRGK
ncbi:MAG: hypothetical protein OEW21_02280 [Betaproteobacteria bacterium]|nr:hypothetical protein [Betaproteobacteria bacterium]